MRLVLLLAQLAVSVAYHTSPKEEELLVPTPPSQGDFDDFDLTFSENVDPTWVDTYADASQQCKASLVAYRFHRCWCWEGDDWHGWAPGKSSCALGDRVASKEDCREEICDKNSNCDGGSAALLPYGVNCHSCAVTASNALVGSDIQCTDNEIGTVRDDILGTAECAAECTTSSECTHYAHEDASGLCKLFSGSCGSRGDSAGFNLFKCATWSRAAYEAAARAEKLTSEIREIRERSEAVRGEAAHHKRAHKRK